MGSPILNTYLSEHLQHDVGFPSSTNKARRAIWRFHSSEFSNRAEDDALGRTVATLRTGATEAANLHQPLPCLGSFVFSWSSQAAWSATCRAMLGGYLGFAWAPPSFAQAPRKICRYAGQQPAGVLFRVGKPAGHQHYAWVFVWFAWASAASFAPLGF